MRSGNDNRKKKDFKEMAFAVADGAERLIDKAT